jgi:hypothetical protein
MITNNLREWLTRHGYDGLHCTASGCSCKADDLHPCGYQPEECVPGVLIECGKCETDCDFRTTHIVDGKCQVDFCIGKKPKPDNHVENWEAIIELRPTLNPDPLDDRPYDWNVVVAIADDASFKFLRWGHLPDDFEDVDKPAMESEYSLDGSAPGVYRARVYYAGYGEDVYMEIDVEECLYELEKKS